MGKNLKFLLVSLWVMLLLYFGFQLLSYHLTVITYPYPLEYREGGIVAPTRLILQGGSPYDLQHQPEYTYIYGYLYHYLLLPWVKIFGPGLLVHRWFSAVWIGLSCLFVFGILKRQRVPLLAAVSAAVIFYLFLIFPQTTTPLAGPHSLGLIFFLGSIYGPAIAHYSAKSLLVSVLLGLIGFYTKPYFILGIPYLTAYLFLFVSKKKGVMYGLLSFVLLVGSAFFVDRWQEFYFNDTIIANQNMAGHDYVFMLNQFKEFFRLHQPIIGILLLSGVFIVIRGLVNLKKGGHPGKAVQAKPNLLKWNEPFCPLKFDLSLFCFLCSMVLVYLKLGRHPGAWLFYLFHLISPFLTLFVFLQTPRLKEGYFLIIPFIFWQFSSLIPHFPRNWQEGIDDWERVDQLIARYQDILNTPPIVPLLVRHNKKIYDSGFTHAFYSAVDRASPLKKILGERSKSILRRNAEYHRDIMAAIKEKKFDLIIITKEWPEAFSTEGITESYKPLGTVTAVMPHYRQRWTLGVWVPQ